MLIVFIICMLGLTFSSATTAIVLRIVLVCMFQRKCMGMWLVGEYAYTVQVLQYLCLVSNLSENGFQFEKRFHKMETISMMITYTSWKQFLQRSQWFLQDGSGFCMFGNFIQIAVFINLETVSITRHTCVRFNQDGNFKQLGGFHQIDTVSMMKTSTCRQDFYKQEDLNWSQVVSIGERWFKLESVCFSW